MDYQRVLVEIVFKLIEVERCARTKVKVGSTELRRHTGKFSKETGFSWGQ